MRRLSCLLFFAFLTLPLAGQTAFGPPQPLVVTSDLIRPGQVTATELNGDGHLDAFAVEAYSSSASIVWYPGDGAGSFGDMRLIGRQGLRENHVLPTDFDLDGDTDLLVGDPEGLALYLNDGSGGFTHTWAIHIGDFGLKPHALADLNRDGHVDIVSTGTDSRFFVSTNDGLGGFDMVEVPFAGNTVRSVGVHELNGDHADDLLVSFYGASSGAVWFPGDGAGGFGSPVSIPGSARDAPLNVTAADLDGDGDVDLAFDLSFETYWAANDGTGQFGAPAFIGEYQKFYNEDGSPIGGVDSQWVLTPADLDGDGALDLISGWGEGWRPRASQDSETVGWYRNEGGGVFAPREVLAAGLETSSVAVADLDANGLNDLLVAFQAENAVVAQLQESPGVFVESVLTRSDLANVQSVHVADLDGDRRPDVVASSKMFDHDRIVWIKNSGTGIFGLPKVLAQGVYGQPRLGDLDLDGDLDVVFPEYGRVYRVMNEGGGEFSNRMPIASTAAPYPAAVSLADLNWDGSPDILVGRTIDGPERDNPLLWSVNNGYGEFGGWVYLSWVPAYDQYLTPEAGDLHGDQGNDVVAVGKNGDASALVRFRSTLFPGQFAPPEVIADGPIESPLLVVDLDGGLPDIVASVHGSLSWFRQSGGAFHRAPSVSDRADRIADLHAFDVDGDSRMDLLVSYVTGLYPEWGGEIGWFRNEAAGTFGPFQSIVTDANTSWDFPTHMGDLDGDGDLDLVWGVRDLIAWQENLGESTAVVENEGPLPTFELHAPYPNPFGSSTSVTFDVPRSGTVRLELFDALGRRVHLLEEGVRDAGTHEFHLNAGDLPAGAYLLRLQSGATVRSVTLAKMR